ncbi:type II toxin-antitoxin system PemK/MazF family toxin [Loigolactobacillus zhaoyuanensis]|uniref:type II toxin-antitoxin system PemK/MazF family toxin n=1 Tax=Loigolactobacillus zhaoyuanensis TaxID=2486017 RepID=UPI002989F164|nr:type II toxin-antitoxin system PemK/MazF family toxin [Loigolactobacillus zhaoyuanensis]
MIQIKKRRPVLVMSQDNYNRATHLVIVCPITSTTKRRPFLVPITTELLAKESVVNTNQLFSLDYTEQAGRGPEVLGALDEETFYQVAQNILLNFNFPL